MDYLDQRTTRDRINNIKDQRDKILVRTLYESGCDLVELVRIKVKDVLGNRIRFSGRFSKISGKLSKDIRSYVQGNNLGKESYLFSARERMPLSEKRARQIIFLNTHIQPQYFRYLHVLHAYNSGAYIQNISRQIGISDYRVFKIIDETEKNYEDKYNEFLKKI